MPLLLLMYRQLKVVHPNSLRSQLWHCTQDPSNGELIYSPIIDRFLQGLRWRSTLTHLWLKRAVYVLGDARVKGHIMEVRDVVRVHNSVAQAEPLSSGVILTVYDENVVDGKHTWQVDYDMVRDYM